MRPPRRDGAVRRVLRRRAWGRCETHARISACRLHDTPDPVAHPITPRQAWREDPLVNGQLLTDVAFELHRRGETVEAEKAEASAARFTAEARGGTSLPPSP
jgi:hypothetical protein